MPDWCLSSALAFPSDLGIRRPCRGLRGWGCAHCQSLPRGELFPTNAIHVHPLLVVAALLAGGAIGGILGMLLAVPSGAFIKLQFEKLIKYRKQKKVENEDEFCEDVSAQD